MGDETVVAPNPSVMDYSSTGFAPTSYTNSGSNAVPDGDVFSFGGAADSTASNIKKDAPNPVPDGPDSGDRTLNNMDSSVMQDTPVSSTHGAIGAPATTENAVTQENSEEKFNEAVSYGSSANANGITDMRNYTPAGTGENGNASNDVLGAATEQQFEEAPASTEEERLWSIVKTNSLDFNAWTAVIEETEKVAEDNISKIRKVYDTFLAEFPLCYGYWKKYADHEGRLCSIEKVVEVYERAVEAVTYSVDIWLHYCIFAISTYGDPDAIRSFKELAGSRPLSELRTAEEAAAVAAANVEASGGADEVRPDGVEQSTKPVSAGLSEAEELEKYIAIREEMYKKAKEYDSKIIGFETAIRRPYFHVRPLIGAELENWHNYLDFIEQQEDFNKVVKLYERCLIACANYPEYWIRYVLCMEGSGSMDLANNALARATQVFVKRQPEIHLFAARFKEQHGDIPGARAAYQLVHSGISPGLLEAVIKHANMEHRLGNMEDALTLYEQAIATEKGKEQSQTLPMLFVQYSRFSFLVGGDAEKARGILIEALEHVQLSKPLLEALIHLETIQSAPKRIDYLDSLVEKFVVPSPDNPNAASTADREEISSIYLEFLDLFGDATSIKKADDRHAKLFLRHRNTSELKKRSAEDFLASDKAKLNKSYAGVSSSAQSLMGSYPSAQNQWAAGYGLQPQAWQQAPQAQGQQWNPGYGQQAGYAAYGGYVNSYTHQQTPTSAPQSAAAYGTYPSSYPVQTFPQQSYQPGTAASFAPAQQQAPVQQAYYGTYY